MSRRGTFRRRPIKPDPIYNDIVLAKLINRVMKDGKKGVARKQVYGALKLVEEKTKTNPLTIFTVALENIRPRVEVRSKRVGGAAYQVPMPVRGPRQDSLAIRWLINSARSRSNKEYHTFSDKLAAEIIDAANSAGSAAEKKKEVERIADANKAFAHLRW